MARWSDQFADEDQPWLTARRPMADRSDLDITPMIDITFLLLIFFLVATVPDPQRVADLPEARHGVAVTEHSSVVVTLAESGPGGAALYLSDGKDPSRLASADEQMQQVQLKQAVEQGLTEGKDNVIIKAERGVAHRDVARVAAAISQVAGVQLHVAVTDQK